MQDLGVLTRGYAPRPWSALALLKEADLKPDAKVADVGCGTGRLYDRLRSLIPNIDYVGIDIEHSPEVRARERDDIRFVTFDGIHVPYPEEHFDLDFANQVFEHVRHQEDLLKAIRRVLKRGGWFVGSLSGLEPFHSQSIFNLTPHGWLRVLNDNGFEVGTIRPDVDCTTLTCRQFEAKAGHPPRAIAGSIYDDIAGLPLGDVAKSRLMLRFAGHIVFSAKRS